MRYLGGESRSRGPHEDFVRLKIALASETGSKGARAVAALVLLALVALALLQPSRSYGRFELAGRAGEGIMPLARVLGGRRRAAMQLAFRPIGRELTAAP